MKLPPWSAAMVQLPTLTAVTVLPATVHTVGVVELKVTASAEVAVAETVPVRAPEVMFGAAPKLMVCAKPNVDN